MPAALGKDQFRQAVWAERMPAATTARLVKLYPPSQWGFLSQVEGGLKNGTCVVTGTYARSLAAATETKRQP